MDARDLTPGDGKVICLEAADREFGAVSRQRMLTGYADNFQARVRHA
jgi:hypothetical protein